MCSQIENVEKQVSICKEMPIAGLGVPNKLKKGWKSDQNLIKSDQIVTKIQWNSDQSGRKLADLSKKVGQIQQQNIDNLIVNQWIVEILLLDTSYKN